MSCKKVTDKKYQTRKSPPFHAGDCKGLKKKGKDGTYVSKADSRGVYKWVIVTGKNRRMKTQKKTQKKNKKTVTNKKETSTIATAEELQKMCKKYNITTSGSKQECAERLWKIRGNIITQTELRSIIPLLKPATQKNAKKVVGSLDIIITDYKGMWKPMPKPLSSMNRNECIKHLQEFRNAWEKITTRNVDLPDERLHSDSDTTLRSHLRWYYSNECKQLAASWLRK